MHDTAFPATTALAVIFAGVLHATWNAMAKSTTDRHATFAIFGLAYTAYGAVGIAFTALPAASAWPWLLLSSVLHTVYAALLVRSYRLGDFNQVYPIARGSAPLIVALLAAVFVGDRLSPLQLAGVATICAGLGVLTLGRRSPSAASADGSGGTDTAAGTHGAASRRPGVSHGRAVRAALATGASIAAYTLSDGIGVRASGGATGYASWLFLLMGPAVVAWALAVRGRGLLRLPRRQWSIGVAGGVIGALAYAIVLWAQTTGALAVVAALRETGVITGAILGVVLFRERMALARVLAAVTVAAGAALINLR